MGGNLHPFVGTEPRWPQGKDYRRKQDEAIHGFLLFPGKIRDEIALLDGSALAPEHAVAVAAKPFVDVVDLGEAAGILRHSHRLYALASPRFTGSCRILRMARGA